jgi:DNA polymerase III delta subunit
MKYLRFVQYARSPVARKVYLITGKNPSIQMDVLHMLLNKVQFYFYSKFSCPTQKMYVDLEGVYKNIQRIFTDSVINCFVIYWKKGLLDEKERKKFLLRCTTHPRKVFIIVDDGEESELVEFFKSEEVLCNRGSVLESNFPYDMEKFIKARLKVHGVGVDDNVIKDLSELAVDEILNAIHLFSQTRMTHLTLKQVVEFNLLQSALATRMVNLLFEKGKMAVLKHRDFLDMNQQAFMGILSYRLLLFLRMKGVSGKVQECAIKLGIPVPVYKIYRQLVMKYSQRELLEKLYLVLRMNMWASFEYSGVLLLNYW